MRIVGETLTEYRTPAPESAIVRELVARLVASGKGDMDYSALATVIFDLGRTS
jgi:hypothetical protein